MILGLLCYFLLGTFALQAAPDNAPNIIFILADDMGWGDVESNNPDSKIPTPHLNRLAAEGISFTDAHSSSSVCSPTRYSVVTGRFCGRGVLKGGALRSFAPSAIEKGRLTVGQLMKRNGYATACFGKWHIGMGTPTLDGKEPNHRENPTNIDWKGKISPSPVDYGFDDYYGIASSLSMPPYVMIENDHFTAPATRVELTWPPNRRRGPMSADFKAENVLPDVTERACAYIRGRKGKKEPFFIYMPLPAPHAPCVPLPAYRGRTGLGSYCDYCVEVDDSVGRVMKTLDESGFRENTLVMYASDNGFWTVLNLRKLLKKGHHPSGPYRGYKFDIYEGGHRIPFFVRWPGKIKPGQRLSEPVCITDLMATCADIIGAKLPNDAAEDSLSILPLLLGTASPDKPFHDLILLHSPRGSIAVRSGRWKLVRHSKSGRNVGLEHGKKNGFTVQLFDMEKDPYEKKDVKDKYPEKVTELMAKLEKSHKSGRSVPMR